MSASLIIPLILWAAWGGTSQAGQGQQLDRDAQARDRLVESVIVPSGIRNQGVIDSIRTTRRHEFVPKVHREKSYYDMALPIGGGQTISPPYVVAFMTEKLQPQPTDRVLEIGTGSGYQAAVLSPLVADVYSIEIVESLGIRARKTLDRLEYENVHTKIGDGYAGWREHAPFDKIIVTCSPEEVPQPLVDQLVDGGLIIVPLGERFQQTLYLMRKQGGQLHREALEGTFFVPMTGTAESERNVQIDESRPRLSNTGFEQITDDGRLPLGWYYARQSRVVDSDDAPEGHRYLAVKNTTPGRLGHAIQSFGVDGKVVRSISLSVQVRGSDLRSGTHKDESPSIIVEFYNASRAPVGRRRLGPWSGSFDWEEHKKAISVPPRAKLGVVGIGLFGGTGELDFDQLQLEAIQPSGGDQDHPKKSGPSDE